jgi:hypothetical protein
LGRRGLVNIWKLGLFAFFHALFVHAKIVKKLVRQKIYYKKLMMLSGE